MREEWGFLTFLALAAVPVHGSRGLHHKTAPAVTKARTFEMRGRWKVGSLINPAHHKLPEDLAAQLTSQRLPTPGEVITGGPERFCAGAIDCNEVNWREDTLADEPGGDRLKEDFAVPLSTRVYIGDTGNRWISYTVLARADGSLAAVVGLCRDREHIVDCYNVLQPWQPISPDAKMVPVSSRR